MDNATETSTLVGLVSNVGDVVSATLDIAMAHPLISFPLACTICASAFGLFTFFRRKSAH